jgi:hypothetical protein
MAKNAHGKAAEQPKARTYKMAAVTSWRGRPCPGSRGIRHERSEKAYGMRSRRAENRRRVSRGSFCCEQWIVFGPRQTPSRRRRVQRRSSIRIGVTPEVHPAGANRAAG